MIDQHYTQHLVYEYGVKQSSTGTTCDTRDYYKNIDYHVLINPRLPSLKYFYNIIFQFL